MAHRLPARKLVHRVDPKKTPRARLAVKVVSFPAQVGGSGSRARPIPLELLNQLGVTPWTGPRSMPLWIDVPGLRGFATMDTARARAAGLACRPLAETLRGALATEEQRTGTRPSGLTDDEEREVLAAVG